MLCTGIYTDNEVVWDAKPLRVEYILAWKGLGVPKPF